MSRKSRKSDTPAPLPAELRAQEAREGARRRSRRDFVGGAAGTLAALALPGALASEAVYWSPRRRGKASRENRIRNRDQVLWTERGDAERVALAMERNQARVLAEFQATSGIKVKVAQAMTGNNPRLPIGVNQEALDVGIQFMIDHLDEINDANKDPDTGYRAIDPELIAALQKKAADG